MTEGEDPSEGLPFPLWGGEVGPSKGPFPLPLIPPGPRATRRSRGGRQRDSLDRAITFECNQTLRSLNWLSGEGPGAATGTKKVSRASAQQLDVLKFVDGLHRRHKPPPEGPPRVEEALELLGKPFLMRSANGD